MTNRQKHRHADMVFFFSRHSLFPTFFPMFTMNKMVRPYLPLSGEKNERETRMREDSFYPAMCPTVPVWFPVLSVLAKWPGWLKRCGSGSIDPLGSAPSSSIRQLLTAGRYLCFCHFPDKGSVTAIQSATCLPGRCQQHRWLNPFLFFSDFPI